MHVDLCAAFRFKTSIYVEKCSQKGDPGPTARINQRSSHHPIMRGCKEAVITAACGAVKPSGNEHSTDRFPVDGYSGRLLEQLRSM